MIRVVIADDSRSFRAILRAILARDPGLAVVGEAVDGVDAVAMVKALEPDVVTMDVRMPGKDGLTAVAEIMSARPTPILVVSAEAGPENQDLSFRALQAGAVEVLGKPSGADPVHFEREAEALRRSVRALAGLALVTRHPRPRTPGALTPVPGRTPASLPPVPGRGAAAQAPATGRSPDGLPAARAGAAEGSGATPGRVPPRAIGVVASTGGPPALARLLAGLPPGFPAALLVVQHIADGFELGLAHWLGRESALPVKLGEHGEPVRPGTVYLAPAGRHLAVRAGTVFLEDGPPVRGFRPSGTTLLASLAREYGATAAALVLTGMGDDGVEGVEAVRRAGGPVLAQGPASSVVFGMPREAIDRGLVDQVVELPELAGALARLVRWGRGGAT